jgi:hypothetical protein
MTTALHLALRFLGVVLGVIWITCGPFISARRGIIDGSLGALGFIALGIAFLGFGLSGPRAKPFVLALPSKVRRPMSLIIGAALVAYGPYLLLARWQEPAVALLLCALYVVAGGGIFWVWGLKGH